MRGGGQTKEREPRRKDRFIHACGQCRTLRSVRDEPTNLEELFNLFCCWFSIIVGNLKCKIVKEVAFLLLREILKFAWFEDHEKNDIEVWPR